MRKYQHLPLWAICGIVYLVSAYYWELSIFRLVSWWVKELVELRPNLTTFQSWLYVTIAGVYALIIIPHFVWFPVMLFKELKYLYDQEDYMPYVARDVHFI
jgi:uncharacterized membrane protein